MKQQLLNFLGSFWMSDIERIENNTMTHRPAVAIYPASNFFTQGLLMTLIEFAEINGYLFYIDTIGSSVRMRIYEDVES